MSLLDKIPDHVPFPIHLLFDNFFTHLPQMIALKEKRVMMTGTMRQGHIPKMSLLTSVKKLKKTKTAWGTTSIACDSKKKVILCQWKDNAIVTVTSTASATTPAHCVKQWSSKEKKKIDITQPILIAEYKKSMGGTDRMDQNIGS